MDTYTYNRACPCLRCRAKVMMGPAILITLGVLFLVDQLWYFRFDRSGIPVLLIVIGVVMFLARSGPTTGHIEPLPPQPPVSTPPPGENPEDPEVNR